MEFLVTVIKPFLREIKTLDAAVLAQDMAAVKDAISKLKGPYSKLFAKFG